MISSIAVILMSEHDQQVTVVKWFELQYPKYAPLLISYPSGAILGSNIRSRCKTAQRNAIAGQVRKLKKEGWRTGIPDLFLAVPRGEYAGLWLEMKDEGKTLCSVSKEQRAYIEAFNEVGYAATWCAGSDAAIDVISRYMEGQYCND